MKQFVKTVLSFFVLVLFGLGELHACSVLYFIDETTGNIYVVNNEDYWYDTKAYLRLRRKTKCQLARIWYGWDNFAQGGVNEEGLFFDGAVTPFQQIPDGFGGSKGNLGDRILAACKNVEEALAFLEREKLALRTAHIMFGDRFGNAVVVEWVAGEKKVVPIKGNRLLMTNFNLSNTPREAIVCPRYKAIDQELEHLKDQETPVNLGMVARAAAKGVQVPQTAKDGREGGTLYTSLINISKMELVLVYKLDSTKTTRFDLKAEFAKKRSWKKKLK